MSIVSEALQDREFGVASLETLKAMSGLEFLQALLERRLPAPPITRTLGFVLTEVSEGHALFRGEPSFDHYNPIGSVHGGWAATLLDSCMGCAVQSTLPRGSGYTTVEFKINLLRGMTDKTGLVEAEGTIVQSGRRVGVAEGRLTDGEGRLLAFGTTTCLIFPL
ncbi:MAG: PaaI family thioesterase [Kiloniellales bacterium]|nr:PaaI family thioesterase [Kiloniellales bacterium]